MWKVKKLWSAEAINSSLTYWKKLVFWQIVPQREESWKWKTLREFIAFQLEKNLTSTVVSRWKENCLRTAEPAGSCQLGPPKHPALLGACGAFCLPKDPSTRSSPHSQPCSNLGSPGVSCSPSHCSHTKMCAPAPSSTAQAPVPTVMWHAGPGCPILGGWLGAAGSGGTPDCKRSPGAHWDNLKK